MTFFWNNPLDSLLGNPEPKQWYMFYYERGNPSPKEYGGPFATRQQANAAVNQDIARYGTPRRQFKVKHLTQEQFLNHWTKSRRTIRASLKRTALTRRGGYRRRYI